MILKILFVRLVLCWMVVFFLLDDLMDKLKEDGFSDYENVAGLCYEFEACIANGFDVLCKIRERL